MHSRTIAIRRAELTPIEPMVAFLPLHVPDRIWSVAEEGALQIARDGPIHHLHRNRHVLLGDGAKVAGEERVVAQVPLRVCQRKK